MDAKKTYLEPGLVDLGDVVHQTTGVQDEGPELNTRLPQEDI